MNLMLHEWIVETVKTQMYTSAKEGIPYSKTVRFSENVAWRHCFLNVGFNIIGDTRKHMKFFEREQ